MSQASSSSTSDTGSIYSNQNSWLMPVLILSVVGIVVWFIWKRLRKKS